MDNKSQNIRTRLCTDGYVSFRGFFDKAQCAALRDDIQKKRPDGPYRFYKSEEAFIKRGRFDRTNPDLEFSLINKFDIDFIDKKLYALVRDVLESEFTLGSRKIIRNIPVGTLPHWLRRYRKFINHNVNPYLLDKYQDEGLNYGADIHQDHVGDDNNWFTAYVYLDEVTEKNAPLNFFKGTHVLGKSTYPPSLRKIDNKILYYNEGGSMFTKKLPVVGSPGDLVLFSAYTLHSTGINQSRKERTALRYLFKVNDCSYEGLFDRKSSHLTFFKEQDFKHMLGKNPI